jgi:carnitine 3-dehydrogenase
LERAHAIYQALGMHPVVLRHEIDGFLADRLLEALWREALWLVHDDVATVEEVDDAISYGPGLRWAIMGTFLTYRLAGGEAGMRHFIEQFGPTLEAPWTKLVDVPELTPQFVERLIVQSDAQAGMRMVSELERTRDDCLVALLSGLRAHDVGAGRTLAIWERGLLDAAAAPQLDGHAPLRLLAREIPPDWLDYNGHVHESRYLQLFADATDALLRALGINAGYVERGGSYYTAETHLSHLRQLVAGDRVEVRTQVLGADDKRLHLFHVLVGRDVDDARAAGEQPFATAEQMLLHVDATQGRVRPAADVVRERVQTLAAAHAGLPRPTRAGRRIMLRSGV